MAMNFDSSSAYPMCARNYLVNEVFFFALRTNYYVAIYFNHQVWLIMLSCDSGQWQTLLCVALFPGLACSLLVYKIREYCIASDECVRPGNEASCVPWQICCLLRLASWVTWPVVTGSCTCITGSCIMMFPVRYLVYSVNYIVSLLITTRTNRVGDYNT